MKLRSYQLNYDSIKTVQDVVNIFKLLGVTFKVEEGSEHLFEWTKGINNGSLVLTNEQDIPESEILNDVNHMPEGGC